jgi:hypothetical protein
MQIEPLSWKYTSVHKIYFFIQDAFLQSESLLCIAKTEDFQQIQFFSSNEAQSLENSHFLSRPGSLGLGLALDEFIK